MASLSSASAHPSTPGPRTARAARLRRIRVELRRGGSAAMDACELLEGRDYTLAARMVDGAEWLLGPSGRGRTAGRMNYLSRQRATRRDAILSFFLAHVGESFPTADMHLRFGPAFRSRVSEMNRDPDCSIRVFNHTERSPDGQEASFYWAELKKSQQAAVATTGTFPEFGDMVLAPESRYPD